MASKKRQQTPTEKAAEGRDPTVRSLRGASGYPEGSHPPVSPADATWGPDRFSYSDIPSEEKPDESTVAQEMDSDPVRDDAEAALQEPSS